MDIVYKRPKHKLTLSIRKIPKTQKYLCVYKCATCGKIVLKGYFTHFGFENLRATPCIHVKDKVFFKRLSMGL